MEVLIKDFILNSGFNSGFKPGSTCYTSALRDVVSYYKPSSIVSDVALFFGINALNISFVSDKETFLGYNFEDNTNMGFLKEQCNVTSFTDKVKDKNYIRNLLINILSSGNPVICFMDSKYLKYDDLYNRNKNSVHTITMFGINTDDNSCYIVDSHIRINFTNFKKFIGKVSLDDIIVGLKCIWEVKNSKELNEIKKDDVSRHFICEELTEYLEGKVISNNIFYGGKALTKYFEKWEEKIENAASTEITQYCEQVHFNIKINGPCYINSNLYRLCSKIGQPLEKEMIEFNNIEHKWEELATVILSLGYRKKIDKLKKVFEEAACLVEVQSKVIQQTLNYFEN